MARRNVTVALVLLILVAGLVAGAWLLFGSGWYAAVVAGVAVVVVAFLTAESIGWPLHFFPGLDPTRGVDPPRDRRPPGGKPPRP